MDKTAMKTVLLMLFSFESYRRISKQITAKVYMSMMISVTVTKYRRCSTSTRSTLYVVSTKTRPWKCSNKSLSWMVTGLVWCLRPSIKTRTAF